MGDKTDHIFQGAGKSHIRKVGSGKAPRKHTSAGEVCSQSKIMQKKSPYKKA